MQGLIRRANDSILKWAMLFITASLPDLVMAEEMLLDSTQEESGQEIDENDLDADLSSLERITNQSVVQFGLGFRKGPGLELGLELYQDEDNLFTFRVGSYTSKNQAGFSKFTANNFIATNTLFLGESLFVGVGGSVGIFTGEDNAQGLNSTAGLKDFRFEGSTYQGAFNMSAGNQWQFDEWTFGFRWLDLHLPFYVGSVRQKSTDDQTGLFAVRKIKRTQDLNSAAWQIDYGASIQLGYNF